MERRELHPGQLLTVLFLALLALGTETAPNLLHAVGAAGWLTPLAAGVVVLAVSGLLWRRGGCVPLGKSLAGVVGETAARWLLLPFLLWGVVLAGVHGVRTGERLAAGLNLSPVLLTALTLALAALLAGGKPAAFGRACEIFALAFGAALGLVSLMAVFRLRWDWLLLFTAAEAARLPGAALELTGVLAVGVYGLFLLPGGEGLPRKRLLRRMAGWFLLLTVALGLIQGRFGPELAVGLERPFFQMVSGLGVPGAFQRLEGLTSALWLLGDLALLGLLLLAVRRMLGQMLARPETRAMSWLPAAGAFLLGLGLSRWSGSGEVFLCRGTLGAAVLAVLILLLDRRRASRKKDAENLENAIDKRE